jgi:2-C-methyl-D-erythritol 2,4-cyclodiphosphate synthase
MSWKFRVGEGFDVHRFVEGRPLILGGINIAYSMGLEGHSDADVLLHAICDALLGAAALGDIGIHFPDDSLSFKNISSLKLLAQTLTILESNKFRPVNVDSTLIMEVPKVAEYTYSMRRNIAQTLKLEIGDVSVKATTTEGLGFTGRSEGIAAKAIALVIDNN